MFYFGRNRIVFCNLKFFKVFLRMAMVIECSRRERPLAILGEVQDLVALELGEAFDDGLGQALDSCPLGLQSGALVDGALLPPGGAASTRGHTADASATWGKTAEVAAPFCGHYFLEEEAGPAVAPFLTGVAEEVLLELVASHGAATNPAWGQLTPTLVPWGLDPTWVLDPSWGL
jgi:hypothetical protein